MAEQTRVDLNGPLTIGEDHYKGERDLVLIKGILYQSLTNYQVNSKV